MADDLHLLVERLKAVSHPLRLRVLALLEAGELCVCQVVEVLQAPQSSVSEALRELRRAGFLSERKEGRWVFVSVVPEREASLLLAGLLGEASTLAQVKRDRLRSRKVRGLSISTVCSKVQPPARALPAPGRRPKALLSRS